MGNRFQRKNLPSTLYPLALAGLSGLRDRAALGRFVLIFAAALGFCGWAPCRSPTSLVGYIFGRVTSPCCNGIVFMGHQIGSFFGGWGGGRLFDLQGNYDMMWWISIALGPQSRPHCTTRSLRSG